MQGKHVSQPKQKKRRAWLLVIPLLLTVCAAAVFARGGAEQPASEPEPPKLRETVAPEDESPSIAIPGYEYLTLAAGTKQQDFALGNPAANTCYFLISLTLDDGTLLWSSDYIAPGENSGAVELLQALEPGTYSAVLKYSCFRMNAELSPLNGAETKLALRVK